MTVEVEAETVIGKVKAEETATETVESMKTECFPSCDMAGDGQHEAPATDYYCSVHEKIPSVHHIVDDGDGGKKCAECMKCHTFFFDAIKDDAILNFCTYWGLEQTSVNLLHSIQESLAKCRTSFQTCWLKASYAQGYKFF